MRVCGEIGGCGYSLKIVANTGTTAGDNSCAVGEDTKRQIRQTPRIGSGFLADTREYYAIVGLIALKAVRTLALTQGGVFVFTGFFRPLRPAVMPVKDLPPPARMTGLWR